MASFFHCAVFLQGNEPLVRQALAANLDAESADRSSARKAPDRQPLAFLSNRQLRAISASLLARQRGTFDSFDQLARDGVPGHDDGATAAARKDALAAL